MSSRNTALVHLNEREFERGEPCIVNYYEDSSENSSINTIVAVGIKDGRGSDAYRVITLGQYEIVWGVGSTLPDISELVHDELYLYQNEYGTWYYVSSPDRVNRVIEPLLPFPHTFLNISDNNLYVSDSNRRVRSINDVYTKSEMDELLRDVSDGAWSSLSSIEKKLDDAYIAIQEVINRNEELADLVEGMSEAAQNVNEFMGRAEIIEKKVESLDIVDSETSNISGTFSQVTFAEGNTDSEPLVLDKSNIITTDNINDHVVIPEFDSPIPLADLESILI